MFWKLAEIFVRTIYRKRFTQSDKIVAAFETFDKGDPDGALTELAQIEPNLHESLTPTFYRAKGQIYLSMDAFEEAEKSFLTALAADTDSKLTRFNLATVTGRRNNLKAAKELLLHIEAAPKDPDKDESEVLKATAELLARIESIESGALEAEYRARAEDFAKRPLLDGDTPGFPADPSILDRWISADKEAASDSADEIALLIGYSALPDSAKPTIGIAIEDFTVVRKDGTTLRPFDLVAKRFSVDDVPLAELLE